MRYEGMRNHQFSNRPIIASQDIYFQFLFITLLQLFILHFLLDQKVKQKIKSHRSRSGEISLGHHAKSFASLVTTSAFRMMLPNRNFHLSSLPRCDSSLILFLFLTLKRPPCPDELRCRDRFATGGEIFLLMTDLA